MTLFQLLSSPGVDFVAIGASAYGLGSPRHGRRNLLLAFTALKVEIFPAVSSVRAAGPIPAGDAGLRRRAVGGAES